MIPEEVLASNPAMQKKVTELSKRRICRLCLSEVDTLEEIDVVWKMKIVSCFPLVTIGSETLPKFICWPCGKFVKKCFEFRQLCKKSEQMLVSYPLTGTWAGELAIPRWLHPEQVESSKKRKAVDELAVPQVGSVRVRSHESLAMSLQSPTITPGSVESSMVVDTQSRQEVIDAHPTVIRQFTQPTNHQPTYAIPVIQSQPVASHYSPSTLPYNSPSQFSNRASVIAPVNQPPQKIQRTNSIRNVPHLLHHPGYTMQQNSPQLVGQHPSCNTILSNMSSMVTQLPIYQHHVTQHQQQHQVTMNSVGVAVNHLQRPMTYNHQQRQHPSNAMNQIPSVSHQQPSISMTPTRYQNYQQPSTPMTPTRYHNYYPPKQQPSITQTPVNRQQTQPPAPPKSVNLWCHVCNFKFLTVDHYNFHSRKHSTGPLGDLTGRLAGRLKTCRLCTAPIFPTQSALVEHLKIHEQVGLTKACDFCVKIFADEERRNEHYTKDHADEVNRTLRLNEQ